jgi:hypothetical protein
VVSFEEFTLFGVVVMGTSVLFAEGADETSENFDEFFQAKEFIFVDDFSDFDQLDEL